MVTMLKNKCSVWKRIKFPTFSYNCYYFTWSDTYFIQLETLLISHPSYITAKRIFMKCEALRICVDVEPFRFWLNSHNVKDISHQDLGACLRESAEVPRFTRKRKKVLSAFGLH